MIKDVVVCFFKIFYPSVKPNKRQVNKIADESKDLLKKGWTYTNITNRIIENKNIERPNSLYKVVPLQEVPPLYKKGNILKDKFYYHNKLQITSKPTEVSIDEDGNLIRKVEPFFLEIVEYFTIEDLTNYFHRKMKIEDENIYRLNRGGFKKIINNYSLDLLLFTIDAAYRDRRAKDLPYLFNYSDIYSYLKDGQSLLNKASDSSSGKIYPYYKAYLKRREKIVKQSNRSNV